MVGGINDHPDDDSKHNKDGVSHIAHTSLVFAEEITTRDIFLNIASRVGKGGEDRKGGVV